MVLKVWSLDQEHEHHPKTYEKLKCMLRPHPTLTEAETVDVGPAVCVLTRSPGDAHAR